MRAGTNGATNSGGPQKGRRFRSRRIAYFAAGLLAVYLALYVAIVFALAARVNDNVAQHLQIHDAFRVRPAATGLALVSGPLTFGAAVGAQAADAAGAKITLPVWSPWRIEGQVTGLEIAAGGRKLSIPQVDTVLIVGPGHVSYRAKLTDAATGPLGAADDALLHAKLTRLFYLRQNAAPEETLRFEIAPLALPAALSPRQDVPSQIDRLGWSFTAQPALTPALGLTDIDAKRVALQAWKQAGGKLTLAPLALDAFGIDATLAGSMQLDDGLSPQAAYTLKVGGLARGYDALVGYNARYHLMGDQQIALMGTMLRLMPGNGTRDFTFDVALSHHWLIFKGAPLWRFGPMPWEVAPEDTSPRVSPDTTPVEPEAAPQESAPQLSVPATPDGMPKSVD